MTAPETPLAVTRGWAAKRPTGEIDACFIWDNEPVLRHKMRNDGSHRLALGWTIVPVEIRELPAEKEKD